MCDLWILEWTTIKEKQMEKFKYDIIDITVSMLSFLEVIIGIAIIRSLPKRNKVFRSEMLRHPTFIFKGFHIKDMNCIPLPLLLKFSKCDLFCISTLLLMYNTTVIISITIKLKLFSIRYLWDWILKIQYKLKNVKMEDE